MEANELIICMKYIISTRTSAVQHKCLPVTLGGGITTQSYCGAPYPDYHFIQIISLLTSIRVPVV